ncbi:MAG: hypothetical protein ACYTG6_16620, partial [Planctomycetota bacterium]
YAVTAHLDNPSRLLTIDTTTGAGSVVATLSVDVTGISFVGTRLLGIGTGAVTTLGSPTGLNGGGNTLATDASGNVFAEIVQGADRDLWSVDPTTGAMTRVVSLTGLTHFLGSGTTFLDGVMYTIDNASGGAAAARDLASLDPVTGAGTGIGPLTSGVDALAGTVP